MGWKSTLDQGLRYDKDESMIDARLVDTQKNPTKRRVERTRQKARPYTRRINSTGGTNCTNRAYNADHPEYRWEGVAKTCKGSKATLVRKGKRISHHETSAANRKLIGG